jgi:hypothetical protein
MQTKELIAILQKLVEEHESLKDVMGEHEIVMDVWQQQKDHIWTYSGVSGNLDIQLSGDGVYHILTAKETWE